MCTAALSLSAVHFGVWVKQRRNWGHLAFAVAGISIAVAAFVEIASLRAESVAEYGALVRWFHVASFVVLVSLVLFVRLQFGAGRAWLAIAFVLVRLAALLANFTTGANLQFREVTGLQSVSLWGAQMVAPVGIANPWMLLGQLSVVVFLAFMIDAALQIRRERKTDEYRRATRIIGSIVGFVIIGTAYTFLAVTLWPMPLFVTPPFMVVLLVTGYELSVGVARNYELAENLRESELRIELTGRAATLGLWSWSGASGQFLCSPRARDLMGFSLDETVNGENLLAHILAGDHDAVRGAVKVAEENGGDFHCEFRMEGADKRVRWLAAIGQMDTRGDPAFAWVHGVLIDITARRQAEERFRRVVQAAPMAMLVIEADGRIVFANDQAERLFGYSLVELYEMNIDALVPASSRYRHAAERSAYVQDAGVRRMGLGRELAGLRRDGSEVPLEIGITPLESDHGLQVVATITDISVRKAMERESTVQREELAHLSRVALLSELSGSLAHELSQPLTAILSNAQAAMRFMAHSPPNLEEVRESLANIVESDKRAGEVIRRLRAMLRKDPPEFQLLDVNEVVQDVLRIIRSDLLNRSVETHLELAPDLPLVLGDRVQLQQVILNLIINGSDAMAGMASGRVLTIRSQRLPSRRLKVQVSDIGKGIPESDLERIFSPFVTTKNEGMGLGLAVCTTIVQAHRGRLWATNNAGPGATMHLELPCAGE